MQQQVAAQVFMHKRRSGRQRGLGIRHGRQVFVAHFYQLRAGLRRVLALRHHERHFVSLEAHLLAAQYGLVRVDQPICVVGNVRRRQHCHDALVFQGGLGIDAEDARVRPVGEDNLRMQHPRPRQVRRVARRARHFVRRVRRWIPCRSRPESCRLI